MGKASRKRRERIEQVQKAREIEGLVKRARLYDWLKHQPNISPTAKVDAVIDAGHVAGIVEGELEKRNTFDAMGEAWGLIDLSISATLPFDSVFLEFPLDNILLSPGLLRVGVAISRLNVSDTPFGEFAFSALKCELIQHIKAYVETRDGRVTARHSEYVGSMWGSFEIGLDDSGRVLAEHWSEMDNGSIKYEYEAYSCLLVILKTLMLLNCRNIVTVDHEPDPADNALYQRHFGVPMTKYRTLAIKPMGKRYERDDQRQQQFDVMPLHIRRGNFAHYTDDAPLFGKYTGTFWRPATAVGNAKNGIRVKDYEVEGDLADYSDDLLSAE